MPVDSIRAAAQYFNGDFVAFYEVDSEAADAVIDWVDNSGADYLARLKLVKSLFHNFSY